MAEHPEIPDWVLRDHERLTNPTPGVPILARSHSPKLHSLQRWQQEAVRLGFAPEQVQLVYVTPAAGSRQRGTRSASDGECLGIQVPEELVDATLDPFWPG